MKTNVNIWGIVKEEKRECHYLVMDGIMTEDEAVEKAQSVLVDGFDFQGNVIIPHKVLLCFFQTHIRKPQQY